MKHLILILVATLSSNLAFAANDSEASLACWDAKSPSGSRPVMKLTAHYNSKSKVQGAVIEDIRFPNDDERYEYLPRKISEMFVGHKVTNPRSVYLENYEYEIMRGLRLILTADVSVNGLINGDVDKRKNGHDAVLDIDRDIHKKWSGGNYYIRLRCKQEQTDIAEVAGQSRREILPNTSLAPNNFYAQSVRDLNEIMDLDVLKEHPESIIESLREGEATDHTGQHGRAIFVRLIEPFSKINKGVCYTFMNDGAWQVVFKDTACD